MSTQRYINTSFWDDSWVQELDPSEKLLYIYLLTNPLSNIAGIMELSVKRICFDTGFNADTINRILLKFEKVEKVYKYDNYIILKNFPKHQNLESEKILKGIVDIIKKLPEDVFNYLIKIDYQLDIKGAFDTLSISYPYPLNYLIKYNINLNSNLNIMSEKYPNQENENQELEKKENQEIKKNEKAEELTTYLLNECKKDNPNFKRTKKELNKWSDAFEKLNRIDGYDYLDIKQVLVWAKTDSFWRQNILSGVRFREKFEQLYIKYKNKNTNSKNSNVYNALDDRICLEVDQ